MAWRGTIEPLDRIWGSLPYLLPLAAVVRFGEPVFRAFPPLLFFFGPLFPLLNIAAAGGFIIFILLFFLVVNNPRIKHFIRFNTMQAIMTEIAVILVVLVFQLLSALGLGFGALGQVIFSTLFLGVTAITIYAWVQNARGHYPEIPTLSDAAYSRIR